VIKLQVRKILHSQPRMLTRDHLAVANLVTLDYSNTGSEGWTGSATLLPR